MVYTRCDYWMLYVEAIIENGEMIFLFEPFFLFIEFATMMKLLLKS